ncbi:MAG: serine/threonine-protein kinase [Gemmataceae bacterium]
MSSGTRTSAHLSSDGGTPALDLSGRTLGDYQILRKLGQGGMGQVYLAEQVSLHRKVALKILRPEHAASDKSLERFRREATAVARATHANIVQVYAFGEVEGMAYLALEYVEGRTLKDYVAKKGPPDLLIALSIMRQVASALQRASELGIIHRDIKPENILLTRKGEAKVADFGLARDPSADSEGLNLTQTGQTIGTPLYMSPEQVEGKPLDSRTDIYSFGVTCYYLLTGQPPFTGTTAYEVAFQHVHREAPALSAIRPDLPEPLCALVRKMMAKDPAQRYQTGRDLLRDIVKLREGAGGTGATSAQPALSVDAPALPNLEDSAPTQVAASLPHTRRLWIALAMVGTLLIAAAVGAALAWREQESPPTPASAEGTRPADASAVETILLPNKREQALRTLVEQTLTPAAGKAPDVSGLGNCIELGLFYLDGNQLEEADRLFTRMLAFKQPVGFRLMGQTGHAIVLALTNQGRDSNKLLVEVFAPDPFFVGPPPRNKKGMAGLVIPRRVDLHLAPIKPFLDHPRGKHWLGRSLWYNAKNGVPQAQMPRYLLYHFPLDAEAKK